MKRLLISHSIIACLLFLQTSASIAEGGLAGEKITTQGDVIKVPVGQQADSNQHMQRPTIGMNQEQVEKQFGAPLSKKTPTGTPPITRWEYDMFVVYFESNIVIHSVIKTQP
jgi:hypothetical protein